MLLPYHIIKTISHFKVDKMYYDRRMGYCDLITIYYKQWWKWSKEYKFIRYVVDRHTDEDGNKMANYGMSDEAEELIQQLQELAKPDINGKMPKPPKTKKTVVPSYLKLVHLNVDESESSNK